MPRHGAEQTDESVCGKRGRSRHAAAAMISSGTSAPPPDLLNARFASYNAYSRRLGDSVTVTRQILDLFIGVRIPVSQPYFSSLVNGTDVVNLPDQATAAGVLDSGQAVMDVTQAFDAIPETYARRWRERVAPQRN